MPYLLTLLFCLTTSLAFSQFRFDFDGTQQEDGVFLTWTLKAGSTCGGMSLEHSTDSINYVTVWDTAGQCGDAGFDVTYNYFHQNPSPNVTNYYRIHFNQILTSFALAVPFVNYGDDGYVLSPNPVSDVVKISFENLELQTFVLEVYDIGGKQVMSFEGQDIETSFSTREWNSGVYFFSVIFEDNSRIIGRFVR